MFKRITWLPLLVLILLSGCNKQAVKTIFQQRTPYEAYQHSLDEAKLHHTVLGKAWLEAGRKAFQDSLPLKLPYQETGYFRADQPRAAGYAFQARQGELIEVKVSTRSGRNVKLYLDLFELSHTQPRQLKHLAAGDTAALQLQHIMEENKFCLVRLQPELLSSESYTITISAKPSLGFPVAGKDGRAIGSLWGADRDNGARRHEGVDIFAAKGTPVIAAATGIVTRVGETPVGGKVVWLTDMNRKQSLYYAHLDKQLVSSGQRVFPGDTLGLVGNTGNAKGTVPHLHFGIYSFGHGAVDPYPFVFDSRQKPATVTVNEKNLGEWGRTGKKTTGVLRYPEAKSASLVKLPPNSAVQVLAGTGNWYKVQLPGGLTGFLSKENLHALNKPLHAHTLMADAELREIPAKTAVPVSGVKKNAKVAVLGFYQDYRLVELADGTRGWLPKT